MKKQNCLKCQFPNDANDNGGDDDEQQLSHLARQTITPRDQIHRIGENCACTHSLWKTAARKLVKAAPAQPPENSCLKIGESCACEASRTAAKRELCLCRLWMIAARTLARGVPARPPEKSCQNICEGCACTALGKQLPENWQQLRLRSLRQTAATKLAMAAHAHPPRNNG